MSPYYRNRGLPELSPEFFLELIFRDVQRHKPQIYVANLFVKNEMFTVIVESSQPYQLFEVSGITAWEHRIVSVDFP